MSEKYIAKKYVTVRDFTNKQLKCPNCHQLMCFVDFYEKIWTCTNRETSKLFKIAFKEVKALVTIERVEK